LDVPGAEFDRVGAVPSWADVDGEGVLFPGFGQEESEDAWAVTLSPEPLGDEYSAEPPVGAEVVGAGGGDLPRGQGLVDGDVGGRGDYVGHTT